MAGGKESIFDILKDPMGEIGDLEQEYLGPDYKYYKKIKSPSQLGMGSRGSFDQLGKDISGLVSYVEVLVTGRSKAQTKNTPLGDRFFLKTGAQCKDGAGQLQDRWIYVDNVPDGNIPIISSALDSNFTEFEGLVPGAISKMNDLNPAHLMKAFVSGSEPPCRKATLSTIDVDDNASFGTQFISDYDISEINPCNFRDKKNPMSGKGCQEGFQSMSLSNLEDIFGIRGRQHRRRRHMKIENMIETTYYTSLSMLALFLLYKLISKSKNK